jgi:hypothetical protein
MKVKWKEGCISSNAAEKRFFQKDWITNILATMIVIEGHIERFNEVRNSMQFAFEILTVSTVNVRKLIL